MELKRALGARKGANASRFALYIPDSDSAGNPVPDLEKWKEAALAVFADVNGGATLLPPAQGVWKPEGGGDTVREATSVVYSFIRDRRRFERGLSKLAIFIHTFGKHAGQGEVMVEFSGEVPGRGFVARAYFIDDYTMAGGKPF